MKRYAILMAATALVAVPALAGEMQSGDTAGQTTAQASPMGEPSSGTASSPGSATLDAQSFVDQASISGEFEIRSSEIAADKAESEEVRTFAQSMVEDHGAASEALAAAAEAEGVQVATGAAGGLDGASTGLQANAPAGMPQTDVPAGADAMAGASGSMGAGTTGGTASTGTMAPGAGGGDTTASGATGSSGATGAGGMSGTTGSTGMSGGMASGAETPSPDIPTGSIDGTTGATSAGTEAEGPLDAAHQAKLDELEAASGTEFDQAYVDAQVEAHEKTVELFQDYAENGEDGELKQFAQDTLPTLEQHLEEVQAIQQNL